MSSTLQKVEVAQVDPGSFKIVRPRHPGRWLAICLSTLVVALILVAVVRSPNMQWSVVGDYLFDSRVLDGVFWTIVLTVCILTLATALGAGLALMTMSASRTLRMIATVYIWLFRGTPLLVQLIFWFNLALLFPVLGPEMILGEGAGGLDTNEAITWFLAALIAFSLHDAAYNSEIIRGGLLAVGAGQREAAAALGLTERQAMRRIILPQAMRIIVPPWVNQLLTLIKTTALVVFISGQDLLSNVQKIYSVTYEVVPLLIVASIWYLVLTSVTSVAQHYVERRLGRGFGSTSQRRPRRRLSRLTLGTRGA